MSVISLSNPNTLYLKWRSISELLQFQYCSGGPPGAPGQQVHFHERSSPSGLCYSGLVGNASFCQLHGDTHILPSKTPNGPGTPRPHHVQLERKHTERKAKTKNCNSHLSSKFCLLWFGLSLHRQRAPLTGLLFCRSLECVIRAWTIISGQCFLRAAGREAL